MVFTLLYTMLHIHIFLQTNFYLKDNTELVSSHHFSLHQTYRTNSVKPPIKSQLFNVQPTSHTLYSRVFRSLPNTTENLKFINKFNFQFSDLTDIEYITLCSLLLKYKTCYPTHKNDVGKNATPFRIRLNPNAQFITQRPSKVLIHYRDKLNTFLKKLGKNITKNKSVLLHKTNQFMAQIIQILILLFLKMTL